MKLYPPIQAGQAVRIPWRREDYKMQCCDCGLVHRLRFSVRRGTLTMRAWRDNRATAQVRRWRGEKAQQPREAIMSAKKQSQKTALTKKCGVAAEYTLTCEHPACHATNGVADYVRNTTDLNKWDNVMEREIWRNEPIALCSTHAAGRIKV